MILLRRTSKAAGRLSEQFRAGTVEKSCQPSGGRRGKTRSPRNRVSGPTHDGRMSSGMCERRPERDARRCRGPARLSASSNGEGANDHAGASAHHGAKPSAPGPARGAGLPIVGDRKHRPAISLLRRPSTASRGSHCTRIRLTFTHPNANRKRFRSSARVPADWPS